MTETALPLIVVNPEPGDPEALRTWYETHRDWAEAQLLVHGAILFRGFGVASAAHLDRAVALLGGPSLDYVDGNSPRRKLANGIYTSTEYPPEFFISLHNELSYSPRWPARVFFCCVTPAAEGGETPLVDSRKLLRALPDRVRETFTGKGIRYIRNLHAGRGFGPSWQTTFETDDRQVVETFCRTTGTDFRWNDDGSLSVTQIRPATARHPRTGEEVWFNQADQFHPSTHPRPIYESILALYDGREDLMPQTATFGDGTPIDPLLLDEVRRTAGEQMRLFPWQEGDLLMVDNMLVAHGRRPYRGERKVLVGMTG